jgi:NADH-quinone oxidoreductase subunit L
MLAGVILTSFYMARQMVYVFFGNRREASAHAHESPAVMTLPLIVLAVCSVLLSVVLTPAWPWLAAYLEGKEVSHLAEPLHWGSILLSFVLVAAGMILGYFIYRAAGANDPIEEAQPSLFRLLENKLWFDEIYQATILSWSRACADISDWLDRNVWDGLVRLVAGITQGFAKLTLGFDEGAINNGADQGCDGAQGFAQILSGWHSGQVQTYLRVIGVAAFALFSIYLWIS